MKKSSNRPQQKITRFLWFNNQAEDAVKFYASSFKNSRIGKVAYYDYKPSLTR